MGQEIEKKYLVKEKGISYSQSALNQISSSVDELEADVLRNGKSIKQGYLPISTGMELSDKLQMNVDFNPNEARLRDKAGKFYFTIKGSGGLERSELELQIEETIFQEYWPKTEGQRVEKVRLKKPFQGHTAEIDVYTDRDLIVAEIEVPTIQEANQLNPLGKDVTEDKKYKNKNLAK